MITDIGDLNGVFFADAGNAAEKASGKTAHSACFEYGKVFRIGHAPVDHHRRHETLFTGKAAHFVVNLIEIRRKFFRTCMLIGAVGELAFGMEGQSQPVAVCLKLLFVILRNIADGKIVMIIMIKEVEQKFCSVQLMRLFQTRKEHLIKKRLGAVKGEFAQKEAAIVNEKAVSFVRLLIPYEGDGKGFFAEITVR